MALGRIFGNTLWFMAGTGAASYGYFYYVKDALMASELQMKASILEVKKELKEKMKIDEKN
jgi:hypothetical protein